MLWHKIQGAGGVGGISYQLSDMSYDSVSATVASSTLTAGLYFKNDGSKVYFLEVEVSPSSVKVREVDFSTNWDITTGTAGGLSSSFYSTTGYAKDLYIKPDGTKAYILGYGGSDAVHQLSFSTAWDPTTLSLDGVSVAVTSVPFCFSFKPDGTKFYVGDNTANRIYQYSLSTAWDISTASYDFVSFSLSATDPKKYYPRGLDFSADGSSFLVFTNNDDSVHQYNMSTPWDVSTASIDTSLNVSAQVSDVGALRWNDDGTKFYLINDTVLFQYGQ